MTAVQKYILPKAALGCREHADSICTHARRAGLVRRARLCNNSNCASQDGSRGAEIGRGHADSICTHASGQASSGAPVSAAAAAAQATTGAEAQKSVIIWAGTACAHISPACSPFRPVLQATRIFECLNGSKFRNHQVGFQQFSFQISGNIKWKRPYAVMYASFIGLRLTKTSLTLINRTRLRTKGQSAGYPQAQIGINSNSFQRRAP